MTFYVNIILKNAGDKNMAYNLKLYDKSLLSFEIHRLKILEKFLQKRAIKFMNGNEQ
jgi:hypothetical protein